MLLWLFWWRSVLKTFWHVPVTWLAIAMVLQVNKFALQSPCTMQCCEIASKPRVRLCVTHWFCSFALSFAATNGNFSLFSWHILDTLSNCNANYSGFSSSVQHLQAYANEQLIKSFDYLLLSANFGTYVKNRPGFAKQFRELSDVAWGRSIDLIKHITKRGGQHDFYTRRSATVSTPQKRILELNEINALALALDTEKQLAVEAHGLHERYSHANHKSRYDAEVNGNLSIVRSRV